MQKRDAAAEQLHGRLISRLFKDPLTKRPRTYWGKVHFRGKEYWPQYFLAVYDDGDHHIMSKQAVQRYLRPVGTVLPEGLVVPEPAAVALLQEQLLLLDSNCSEPAVSSCCGTSSSSAVPGRVYG
eukprot:GHUV01052600.1.p1 GENE.GHUV01052600.1~~GHUV01052600.1.p1  ORF type:complete len:133 (-),score=31.84 GHUV01052600.1:210-584(-)